MKNEFIGTGIIFPIIINATGSVDIKDGNELLQASIKAIIYWPRTQRFFNQTFGSRIFQVLEEPNDNISKVLIRNFIFEALNMWEKRITLKDTLILKSDDDSADLQLTYIINSTRQEETIIFPFYKEIIN